MAVSPWAQAKVYTCLVNGDVVYTSSPKGNCAQAKLQPIGSYSNNNAAYRNTTSQAPRPAATSKPRTTRSSTQPAVATAPSAAPRGNDNSRRQILEQELANERTALAQAQKALTEGRTMQASEKNNYPQYQQRVQQLESTVLDRQQNVQALQRELSRM